MPIVIAFLVAVVAALLFVQAVGTYYARVSVMRRLIKPKGILPRGYDQKVSVLRDIDYKSVFDGGSLDLYTANNASGSQPLVLWVHGGGFIGGDKDCVRAYAPVLAHQTQTAIASINYCLAPKQHYPTPLLQINEALAFLQTQSQRLKLDCDRIFIAGDSAGAQIAAQYVSLVCNAELCRKMNFYPAIKRTQLRGAVLCCGFYDVDGVMKAHFPGMKTFLWAYTDSKKPQKFGRKAEMSVISHVTADFCDTFITCGSSDPLLGQSRELAAALARNNVPVATYFPTQKTGHEYQFSVGTKAANTALVHAVEFLNSRTLLTIGT